MRWVYVLGVLGFFAYAFWMIGPYLRSVIVRDAAVTSWTNLTTAPIDGEVTFMALSLDRVVGEDGVIVRVRNDHLQRSQVTEAEIRLELARAKVEELQDFLADVLVLDQERADLKARYADAFRAELDSLMTSFRRQIEVGKKRLGLLGRIAARNTKLAKDRVVSQNDADEANQRVSDMELELAQLREELDHAAVRRDVANHGVFITKEGDEPIWVRESRLDLKLQKKQVRLELRQAQAEVRLTQSGLETIEEDFRRRQEHTVFAPPGSVVWNERVAPGAMVKAGTPLAEWLDCSSLLIDVPVADAEVPLIKPGMIANVILEGDSVTRQGEVLLTRGSALTLGRDDLAGLAKGRGEGVAQVLLEFSHERKNFDSCPVGRAAYVDFPDVGLIDVIRARLRL